MSIHIYHPSKSVKGFACSFQISPRDGFLMATIVRQAGWNHETQTGSFKDSFSDPSQFARIKLSDFEVGAILDCIERNRPFSTFHQSSKAPKSISFAPWMTRDSNPTQQGFSFSITVKNPDGGQANAFYIGLTFAEARVVREALICYLQRSFQKGMLERTLNALSNETVAVDTPEPEPTSEQPSPEPPVPVKNAIDSLVDL